MASARRHNYSARNWDFNSLEARLMLAGDVQAAISESSAACVSENVQATSDVSSIVFIDSSVQDTDVLQRATAQGSEVVLIDATQDGIAQITAHLKSRRGISSVHLVAHGDEGSIRIGNGELNAVNVQQFHDQLRQWGDSLSNDADILLYGCKTAHGEAGDQLLAAIAHLTGADVAGSDDLTGSQTGDWILEKSVGEINHNIVFAVDRLAGFSGHLGITIRAAGTSGQEELQLEINGEIVQSWIASGTNADAGQFRDFTYDVDGIDINSVRVRFANDFVDPNGTFDRNLRVDYVSVDGTIFQSEAQNVLSTGTWTPGNGVSTGFWQSEFLHANGFLEYSSGSLVEVVASGDTGDESMQLLIDGQVVQTYTDVPTTPTSYFFRSDQILSPDRISVAFINAVYAPEVNYDQNLNVDLIRIDGIEFQTEAPSTFSTGTWRPEDGLVEGFRQSETLHASGVFQFAASGSQPTVPEPQPPAPEPQPTVPQTSTFIEFQRNNFIVREDTGAANLVVTRTGDLSQASRVDFRVPGGFAVPGRDFQPVEGTLEFAPGETQQVVSVPIINDGTPEGTETFTVELVNVSGAAFGIDRTTIVTVNDDDNVNPPGSLNVQLPEGFSAQRIAGENSFVGPTGLKVANDGRVFVTEKFGRIYVVENGQRIETPLLDLTSEVFAVGTSQGLTGFALDPNFDTNGLFYVLYTTSQNGVRFGRLERFAISADNPNQADLASRTVLIGNDVSDGFPDGGDIHLVGDLQFGNDGSLLVSYGDAAGNGDNVTALRNAQSLDNLAGKISRINPANGQGYASNPFFTGDVNDTQSKIWVLGLRNPYRFEIADDGSTNPNDGRPGTLYIGDVQFTGAEELNVARGGENFGWPYFEGSAPFFGTPPSSGLTFAEVEFPRETAQTSIGGAIVGSDGFPASYEGVYLHADFTAGWIRGFNLDAQGSPIGSIDFATGANGITDLEWDPVTGQLYFVALNQANGFQGELYAINFANPNGSGFQPTEISTGNDGSAFAVTSNGEVYRRDGVTWTQLPGAYNNIAVLNSTTVWGLDLFGNLAFWDGADWESVASRPLSDIAVSGNGQLWGTGTGGEVLQGEGEQWIEIGGFLSDIEVDNNGTVWGVNAQQQIWQRAGGQWNQIGGALVDVSVGTDGAVWGVNANNDVWRFDGGGWQQQSITLTSISVATDTDIWGVDPDGQVRRWNGAEWLFV